MSTSNIARLNWKRAYGKFRSQLRYKRANCPQICGEDDAYLDALDWWMEDVYEEHPAIKIAHQQIWNSANCVMDRKSKGAMRKRRRLFYVACTNHFAYWMQN